MTIPLRVKAALGIGLMLGMSTCLPAHAERWVTYGVMHTGAQFQIDLDSVTSLGDETSFVERMIKEGDTYNYSMKKVNCRTRKNWTSKGEWSKKPVDEFSSFFREMVVRRMDFVCYSN